MDAHLVGAVRPVCAAPVRVYLPSGEEIGSFATAAPDWSIDDQFRSGGNRFRIENIVTGDDLGSDEFHGVFVVSPLELAEPSGISE